MFIHKNNYLVVNIKGLEVGRCQAKLINFVKFIQTLTSCDVVDVPRSLVFVEIILPFYVPLSRPH